MIAALLPALLALAGPAEGPAVARLSGEVRAGQVFSGRFGPGFTFELHPMEHGWTVVIGMRGSEENLARFTPPAHFVPNPRDLEGWHFRNEGNTGPNDGSVNAPGKHREFVFSPEVGAAICDGAGPGCHWPLTEEEFRRIEAFGKGALDIKELRLGDLQPGGKASIEWMRFEVRLRWPRSYSGKFR